MGIRKLNRSAASIEYRKRRAKVWRAANIEHVKVTGEARRAHTKRLVFEAYGGYRCVGCGETEILMLTIDHVNQKGHEHRSATGRKLTSVSLYRWLIGHNLPEGYRVLCANCQIRAYHGRLDNGK